MLKPNKLEVFRWVKRIIDRNVTDEATNDQWQTTYALITNFWDLYEDRDLYLELIDYFYDQWIAGGLK